LDKSKSKNIGPSDITIKRILAFSKALSANKLKKQKKK